MPLAVVPAQEASDFAANPLSWNVRSGTAVLLARYSDQPPAAQADLGFGFGLERALSPAVALGLSAYWHWTFSSPILPGGVLYRGYRGFEVGLYAAWSAPLGSPPARLGDRDLRVGLLGGAAGRLERYMQTSLYFFAPSLFAGPFLELEPPARIGGTSASGPGVPAASGPASSVRRPEGRLAWLAPARWGWRLTLPLTAHLRRDMKLNLAAGLVLDIRLHPPRKEPPL